jgi:8-oxo-dGTP pyrophosphatase MutT (NUDIX family)
MKTPDISEQIEYGGQQILVNWFDLVGREIPDLPWRQVYAIGDVDGLVPIVHYDDDHDNLPGGTTEPGESVEQTLIRELDEEIKMKVISWEPLGYQEWIEPDGNSNLSLRVYATLFKKEEFTNDPGGPVIGHSLIELDELNDRINYHKVGDRMMELAKGIRDRALL